MGDEAPQPLRRGVARAVLPHGTTTVITDPHEIANVCGMGGIDYMMAATENLPLDVHFMLPSCVPAMAFEENGATLTWRDINAYFDHPRVPAETHPHLRPHVTYALTLEQWRAR